MCHVAGVEQRVPRLLGYCNVSQGHRDTATWARVAGVLQHVPGSLGYRNMCRGHWGTALCARVTGAAQHMLEREISAKLTTEVHQTRELKNLGLGV